MYKLLSGSCLFVVGPREKREGRKRGREEKKEGRKEGMLSFLGGDHHLAYLIYFMVETIF